VEVGLSEQAKQGWQVVASDAGSRLTKESAEAATNKHATGVEAVKQGAHQAELQPPSDHRDPKAAPNKRGIQQGFRGRPGEAESSGQNSVNSALDLEKAASRQEIGQGLIVKHRNSKPKDNAQAQDVAGAEPGKAHSNQAKAA
jgi:hypothetical protein